MARRSTIPMHKLSEHTDRQFHLEMVDVSEEVKKDIAIDAHRDDHYLFMLLETGWTRGMIEFNRCDLRENMILFVLPGQVHDFQDAGLSSRGWLLAIEPSLVPEPCRTVLEDPFLEQQALTIDADIKQPLVQCLRLIDTLQQREDSMYLRQSIYSLLASFAGMIADLYAGRAVGAEGKPSRARMITREFRQLVAHRFKTLKSPAEYASELHLSLSYLNEIVKDATGYTVSYWIQREVIQEAKRLLYYSRCSVKEIAFELGYEDHTYFSRLFKKVEGRTPGEFREMYRE
ncbi:MAG: AraC family transcriptional regulator [Bacteroidetes bacterium]|nr:AraC family transcriptional regulator [Bacteroidota bacterium]